MQPLGGTGVTGPRPPCLCKGSVATPLARIALAHPGRRPRLAIATWDKHPGLYAEEAALPALLEARGVDARPVVWSDPDVDWRAFDAVLVRSTWDYVQRLPEFFSWFARLYELHVPLLNPLPLLHWNLDKRYLRYLEERGARIVPTCVVERGEAVDAAALLRERGWTEAVVKPVFSGGAYRTYRVGADPGAARRALAEVLEGGPALVQPYLPEIATEGEWSLFFFGGRFSHAVLKAPAPGDFRTQPQFGGSFRPDDPGEVLVAEAARVLALAPYPPLYARVDGVRAGGHFLLMELELIEPYLFLAGLPEAAARFADVVAGVFG